MDWNQRYRLARDLMFEIANDGELVALTVTGALHKMPVDVVALVCGFASPIAAEQAFAELAAKYELDREGFEAVVDELLAGRVLEVDVASAPRGAPFKLESHLALLRDTRRLQAYQVAIERAAPGKTVVVLDAGIGIYAAIAARAGARKVYAIERSGAAEIARELLAANHLDGIVEIVRSSVAEAQLPERGDLLVHDLIRSEPINDGVLPVIEHARTHLAVPNAVMLPHAVRLSMVGVDAPRPDDGLEQHAAIGEIGALCGLSLEPFEKRIAKLADREPTPPRDHVGVTNLVTEELPYLALDLRQPVQVQLPVAPVSLNFTVDTRARLGGFIGVCRIQLDDRTVIGNHPSTRSSWSPTWYGLPRSLAMTVTKNDRIALQVSIGQTGSRMTTSIELA